MDFALPLHLAALAMLRGNKRRKVKTPFKVATWGEVHRLSFPIRIGNEVPRPGPFKLVKKVQCSTAVRRWAHTYPVHFVSITAPCPEYAKKGYSKKASCTAKKNELHVRGENTSRRVVILLEVQN